MKDQGFRWRAFFQRSSDPLFLINRQGYILFVNRAWETLTGISAAQAKRLWCRRTRLPADRPPQWTDIVGLVLSPPEEVFQGSAGRERRLVPAWEGRPACWWDLEYLPLREQKGFRGLLGRIASVADAADRPGTALPEAVVKLRERGRQQFGDLFLSRQLPALRRVAEQVTLASGLRTPVLLVGDAGTGKETMARVIHLRGPDRERAFAALDCRRLPPLAVGTLLFGEKGMLARAPVATLFLNGPDALPRELQRLLYEWLIGAEEHPLRLLAGCRAADEALQQGRLLPELYHALATLRIDLPTLAERRDELPHLVDRLLRRLNGDGGRTIEGLSPDAWEVVLAYDWPGNFRELFAVLESGRQHTAGSMIDAADLPAYLRRAALPEPSASAVSAVMPLVPLLEKVERRLIELALRRTRGNQTQAADLLAVWRPYLCRRMKQLGIEARETPQAKRAIKKRSSHRLSPPPTEGGEG